MSYDPKKDPNYDPNATYGDPTNPYAKTNIPSYTGPSAGYQQMFDWISKNLGGPAGLTDVTSGVRGTEQTPFLSRLPWGQEQIGGWLTNQMTGKGAKERADALRKI